MLYSLILINNIIISAVLTRTNPRIPTLLEYVKSMFFKRFSDEVILEIKLDDIARATGGTIIIVYINNVKITNDI